MIIKYTVEMCEQHFQSSNQSALVLTGRFCKAFIGWNREMLSNWLMGYLGTKNVMAG